jgi:hypothetical protein
MGNKVEIFNVQDIFGLFFILIFSLSFAFVIQTKNKNTLKHYRFYFPAMFAKLMGAVAFSLIYVEYYGEGDTIMYFKSARAFANLLVDEPVKYFQVVFNEGTPQRKTQFFSPSTGYPYSYLYLEPSTCMVLRLASPIVVISGGSYLISTLIISFFSFFGTWNLYRVFVWHYPQYYKKLALPILFMPSVLFWGSGILKDSFTYLGMCYFIWGFFLLFKRRKYTPGAIFSILLGGFLILTMKPYIMLVLLPGALFWINYSWIVRQKSPIMKFIMIPVIFAIVIGGSGAVFLQFSQAFAKFSVDKALDTAAVTSNDLKQDYYDGASFNIGTFDGTAQSALELMPNAIIAGLFRPFLWEAGSPVVLISAMENLFLIFLLLRLFIRSPWTINTLRVIFANPFVAFCFFFSILFSFTIGLSTSNFGALVRFKIPLIPFYAAGITLVWLLLKDRARRRYEQKIERARIFVP